MSASKEPRFVVFGVRHDLLPNEEQKAQVVVNNVRKHLKRFRGKPKVAVELTPAELEWLRGMTARKLEVRLHGLLRTPMEFRISYLRFWHRIVRGLKGHARLEPIEDPGLQEEFHQAMAGGYTPMLASFYKRNRRAGNILTQRSYAAALVGLRHIQGNGEATPMCQALNQAFGPGVGFKKHQFNDEKERYEIRWEPVAAHSEPKT